MSNKKIFNCRSCGNNKLIPIFDLGDQPLANALLENKKQIKKEKSFPLKLVICKKCKLLQLNFTVNPSILFRKYLWVTGTSNRVKSYRQIFFKKISKYLKKHNNYICEIASNDGFFLNQVKKKNKVLGIDPAINLAKHASSKGIKTLPNFFNFRLAKKIVKTDGDRPNIIICRNVIPHVENLNDVLKGIHYLISTNGYGIIEFHNAAHMLKKKHYDYIYHEHIFYYTLTTLSRVLKKQKLFPFDFFLSPISGGSYVIIFSKKKLTKSKKYTNKLKFEKKEKLDDINYWKNLGNLAKNHKEKLLKIISLYSKNKNMIGYGASARSSTLLNYLKLNNKTISKIIDANPLKKNLFTPGSNIKISLPYKKAINSSDVILLLAWNFKNEILKNLKKMKFKGDIIIPLPNIKIIKKK